MQRDWSDRNALEIAPTLLGKARWRSGAATLDEAEGYFDESFAIYRTHGQERTSDAASVMNELAGLYSYRGD